MSGSALHVIGLTKRYGRRVVIDDLSLTVEAGQVVGLLGPNGVGKSTTMRVCAGSARADSGRILVAGVDFASDPLGARRQLGYLPDVGGLFPRLSAMEHLELAGRLWQLPQWRRRADALLERLGLGAVAHQHAGTFSHGMSRRLGVAVALLAEPALVLLDEPFDGVDPVAAREVRALIAEAAAAGAGVLCSTHLLDVAERSCDRLDVVADGRIVASGTGAELRSVTGTDELEDAYVALAGGHSVVSPR